MEVWGTTRKAGERGSAREGAHGSARAAAAGRGGRRAHLACACVLRGPSALPPVKMGCWAEWVFGCRDCGGVREGRARVRTMFFLGSLSRKAVAFEQKKKSGGRSGDSSAARGVDKADD